jgi:UDP-glucose 4-epimerase
MPEDLYYNLIMKQEFEQINLIVGGNGFIGQNLVKALVPTGHKIVIADKNIWQIQRNRFGENVTELDLGEPNWKEDFVKSVKSKCSVTIWHLAANSDIAKASVDFEIDFNLTLGSTLDVVSIASALGPRCKSIEFTSSSAVYGIRQGNKKFREEDKLIPISNYGVMKEASEKVLNIFSQKSKIPIHIYRLANIVGNNMTHGLIYDLSNKLLLNSTRLQVLGNGYQRKTYLHVSDLVNAMIKLMTTPNSFTVNAGPDDDGMNVREIAELLVKKANLHCQIEYEEKAEGWFGDVVDSVMETALIRNMSNDSMRSSFEAINDAISSRLAELS